MAIYKYGQTFPPGYDPARIESYEHEALLQARQSGLSARNMLTLLGDYWTDYFAETELLKAVHAGAATLIAEESLQLLRQVLASSIIDFPFDTAGCVNLFVFDAAMATYVKDNFGNTRYISYLMPELKNIGVLTDRLFEPSVVLEKGAYFEIIDSGQVPEVRFYVDIFQDENMLRTVTNIELDRRIVLLWGADVLYKERLVYERFGRFLYSTSYDTQDYHFLIMALQRYYITTKSIKNIEAVVNILMGVPYARYDNEKVVSAGPAMLEGKAYHRIETDKMVYWAPLFSDLMVTPGQVLNRLDLLSRITTVADYITNPTWYDKCKFPGELLVSGTHPDMPPVGPDGTYGSVSLASDSSGSALEQELHRLIDQVLKYNLIYVKTNYSEEFAELTFLSLREIYDILVSGLPVYLHPIIQGSIGNAIEDVYDITGTAVDDLRFGIERLLSDTYTHAGDLRYDGKYTYSGDPPIVYGNELDTLRLITKVFPGTLRWHSRFDDRYWQAVQGNYIAPVYQSEAVDGLHYIKVQAINDWNIDYRPKAIRITTTDGTKINIKVSLADTADNILVTIWEYESTSEFLLDFSNGIDMTELELISSWPLSIENIEFLSENETFISLDETSFEDIGSFTFEDIPIE